MMSTKEYKEFLYIAKEDYDSKLGINEDDIRVYSKKKLKELYPNGDYVIVGETYEKKKRDKQNDIGRIELNEKRLYVSKIGTANKLLKKQGAFVEVSGGLIAILKLRLLPILLIIALLLGGGLYGIFVGKTVPTDDDPGINKVENEILTISGSVTKGGAPIEGAVLSLQKGCEEVGSTTSDADGNYLISDVKSGNYNLVCIYGDSTLTKLATVNGMSIIADFRFPADDLHDVEEITDHHKKEELPDSKPSKGNTNPEATVEPYEKGDLPDSRPIDEKTDVKAIVNVPEGTPAIAVGGLDTEAMLHMIVGKEVDLTFLVEKLDEANVPSADKNAITAISGELELTYYDFSVLKEVFKNRTLESSEYLKNTKTVLEIAVPYDSSMAVGTYVFRCHDGVATRFEELPDKPAGNFQDGTCYVTADTVYVYTNCFSTYAIGSVSAGHVVRGSDTITYSDKATINLRTKQIDMMYRHDNDSTNAVRIELYIAGEKSNLLVAESGIIPVGYEITEMTLTSGIKNMPSVGTYNGLMKIIYLGTDGDTNTNVDIPLSIAITQ